MKRRSLFHCIIALLLLCSQRSNAAEDSYPGTLDISPALFNQLTTEGWCATNQISETEFVAIAGGGEPGHWTPPIPTCVDGLTPEFIAEAEAAANAECRPIMACVQRGNCAFEAIIFYPTSPSCFWAHPVYAASLAVTVVPTGKIEGRQASSSVPQNVSTWSLYPNPASSTLNLSSPLATTGNRYQITNMLGQVLQTNSISNQSNNVDISNLPGGLYILNVFNDADKVQTLKFVKQ